MYIILLHPQPHLEGILIALDQCQQVQGRTKPYLWRLTSDGERSSSFSLHLHFPYLLLNFVEPALFKKRARETALLANAWLKILRAGRVRYLRSHKRPQFQKSQSLELWQTLPRRTHQVNKPSFINTIGKRSLEASRKGWDP